MFNNFINNQVNIKEILQQGTPVEDLPTFEVLGEKIFKLMSEIVVKVNADRGTPIGPTPIPPTPVASGISGISPEVQAERIKRLEERKRRYDDDAAMGVIRPTKKTGIFEGRKIFTYGDGDSSNMVQSVVGKRTRVIGGKKKKYTRRPKKAYKKKTLKRDKKHNKTIKHRKSRN